MGKLKKVERGAFSALVFVKCTALGTERAGHRNSVPCICISLSLLSSVTAQVFSDGMGRL